MKLCILCENSKVELARENTKKIFGPKDKDSSVTSPMINKIKDTFNLPKEEGHLQIPCSETGNLPATHWFCFLNTSDDVYQKIKTVQEHSIIEESSPKEFLEKWNLKIIK